jgi:anti-sigma factor RsiW
MSGKHCIKEILLSEYLDGELSDDAARMVGDHLLSCETCKDTYERLKAESSLFLEHLRAPDPPAHMKMRIFRRIDGETETGLPSRLLSWLGIGRPAPVRLRAWTGAAAAVVLVAAVFSTLHLQSYLEDKRILAEIERSGEQWAARDDSLNPFNIDIEGDPLPIKVENPFESFLNER